jgi:hypothetical protein
VHSLIANEEQEKMQSKWKVQKDLVLVLLLVYVLTLTLIVGATALLHP